MRFCSSVSLFSSDILVGMSSFPDFSFCAMSSTSTNRERSPSPAIPTPTEIRAFLQQKAIEEDNRVRYWMSVDVFSVLRDAGNYTVRDGVVSIERDFYCHFSDINFHRVESVARAEIERKMPMFKVVKLELRQGGERIAFSMRLHLTEKRDAAAAR